MVGPSIFKMISDINISRHSFISTIAAYFAVPKDVFSISMKKPSAVPGGIRKYNKLGNTGLYISDISFGAGGIMDPAVILFAMDKGINYFDTSPDYGDSEEILGKAFRHRKAQREKFIVTTKLCKIKGYPGHYTSNYKKNDIIKMVDDSLKRMHIEYIDFLFIHALQEDPGRDGHWRNRLGNPVLLNAYENLRKQGKVRFLGFSDHSGSNLSECIEYASKLGYRLAMPATWTWRKNYKQVRKAMKTAGRLGMGFLTMKVLKLRKEGINAIISAGNSTEELNRACIKYVSGRNYLNSSLVNCNSKTKILNYLKASGLKLTKYDKKLLKIYDDGLEFSAYCNFSCDSPCQSNCPNNYSIQNIMRFSMYDKDYHSRKVARMHYQQLDKFKAATNCISCMAPCSNVCPEKLNIKEIMIETHRRLV